MKKLFTLSMVMIISLSAFSQAPQKMSYQAVIRNNSDQLVTNHAVGMRVSILQGSSSGTVVYTETQTPSTNANGLVSIELGGGAGFDAINWANNIFFIKTETDPTGGTSYTITGTSQILSVPYALQAKTASTTDYNTLTNLPTLNIANWNTAYGWGNHAGLYRAIGYVPAWSEITSKPTTISGYGIIDAVTLTGNQSISGIKTFNSDILVNGLTIGKGKNTITFNTAVGVQALFSNTVGTGNTAGGYKALYSNTTTSNNTAYGYQALTLNVGFGNTATGVNALGKNTSGENNTATGCVALYNNSTGNYNTAVGYEAMYSNSTGTFNTAIGNGALYSGNASANTAIGYHSLYYNSGNNNTAVGKEAHLHNTSGALNTAIGTEALYNYSTGSYNSAIGYKSMKGADVGIGHHNTAIGNEALTNLYGGHNNTSTGSISLQLLTIGSGNTANGYSALNLTTTGSHNTGIGVNAGNVNTTGSDNTCIGYFANVGSNNLTNATAIGYNAIVNANNKIVLGNASATTVGGYGVWTNYSDRRLKENINYNNKLGLDFITRLKPVTFNYINDTNKHTREGLIAQDVEQVLKELGLEFSGLIIDDDQEKTMNLSYPALVIPLITAVQEQQKQIKGQQKEIEELKALVTNLIANQTAQSNN